MAERIALYPGSFDPPTLGHFDLIHRARRIFDRVVVAVAINEAKTALFTVEERMKMLEEEMNHEQGIEITSFSGLSVEFARKCGAQALIRGLRVVSDFEFELSLAINNQKLDPGIDTVCLMPSEPFLFLSSRQVKEIVRFGGSVSHYVSPKIEKKLREKLLNK
ncbi:MAG TPA: pantetheine-phosphate adenylyltransferase [Candidatus Hydrogenedens sp.]|nr:pantetheine-phosphate adenylyltransferase [Candidatus Hydrogenedens sp.]HOK10311.1 pantetheine-phosphate adenylyltransferase [Candidatus Hydrogenedens sp.]HOL20194.1 pantetheine-phosphate adenylyltransferase [Candidatus Hydrogenedens sp.]HPP59821.1 pantetheine-phosphate adenylyltransferase [Candidatus Hydrogenedens sp.]